jgi:hypothetical protein
MVSFVSSALLISGKIATSVKSQVHFLRLIPLSKAIKLEAKSGHHLLIPVRLILKVIFPLSKVEKLRRKDD